MKVECKYLDPNEEDKINNPMKVFPAPCSAYGELIDDGKESGATRIIKEKDYREDKSKQEHQVLAVPRGCVIFILDIKTGEYIYNVDENEKKKKEKEKT